VAAAQAAGLAAVGVSSHAPVPFTCSWTMTLERFREYVADARVVQERWRGSYPVWVGVELDYLDAELVPDGAAFQRAHVLSAQLDYAVVSLHFVGRDSEGQPWAVDESAESFAQQVDVVYGGNVRRLVEDYYRLMEHLAAWAQGLRIPVVVGHLDKVKQWNVTATTLGLPHELVTIVPMEVGGGFGGKTVLLEPLVAAVALRLGRPVKLTLTRTEEFLLTTPAPAAVFELRGGVRRDGTLTALQARVVFDSGAYPGAPVNIALLLLGGTYRWEHLDLVGYEVLTNKPGTGAYRAPGVPQATFAVEQLVDELAQAIGMDPLELRLRNAARTGDPQPNGVPWPPIGLVEVLERVRDHPLWKNRQRIPNEGWGIAVGGWPGGIEPCAANVRLNHDGTFTVTLGAIDITGTHTVLAMIAAEVLGQPLERVRIALLPSDAAPYAGMSGGSKITYTVGLAVKAAAEEARRQLLEIAANELEVAPEDLEVVEGAVRVRGVPDRQITLQQIAALSMAFGGRYAPVYGTGRVAVTQQSPGFNAQIAHVRVDPETGQVKLLDLVAIQDVGRALHPALVEAQVHGGAAQGVGWALHEAMRWDESGQPLNPTFLDYDVPKASQLPPLQVELVEVPSPIGPFGAKGVGEPPVTPTAAAIANAIADATGLRFTELPILAERVRAALTGLEQP